uniref:Uncharacterized protein n=1 Tax=Tanacetum cinerariifolium TaxID=118510 RepID=A0A699VTS0_TANCI|nr:hypothetical protein [Tanacetum cinerariifolium]
MSSINTMTNLSKNSWKTRFIKSMHTAGALSWRYPAPSLVTDGNQTEVSLEVRLEIHLETQRQSADHE